MRTYRPASRSFSLRSLCLSVYLAGIATSSFAATSPNAAIKAVQNTLPSVAILGQKAGPSDTTEVFIQVPGVLNMQSVYVLGDDETVISGVVVPPIANGFPGAGLTLPDGKASVDPRRPRTNTETLNQVLGIEQVSESTRPATQVAPVQADTLKVPAPPARGKDSLSSEQAGPALKASSVSPSASAAGEAGSGVPSPAMAMAMATAEPAALEPTVIESLDQVAESGAFSRLVGLALENDQDVAELRAMAGTDEQAGAYLDLVRTLPSVVQGSADRKVYVMFDPNCPVCHRYYEEVSLEAASGQLQVHWIPAIVFPDNRSSLTASAALLAEVMNDGGEPLKLLDALMTDDSMAGKIDGAPGVDKLVPYLDMVVKNTAIMAMARAETPLIIFENTGGELAISPGIPKPGYISLINKKG